MARVLRIGGVFLKAKDPAGLAAWYQRHLGFELKPWGGVKFSGDRPGEVTAWCLVPDAPESFAPSQASFMVNYVVDDLHALLKALRAEGCEVDDKVDESAFGKFGWVMDPEGNRLELWQPPETN